MLDYNFTKGLVSIVCLGYKHADFIKDNIFALWKNAYTNIEIIAIDDGSNDGSAELLFELAKQSPYPMQVIAQENTGDVANNFNKGIYEAKGEFITVMSFDDVLTNDAISTKVQLMAKKPNIAFIFNDELTTIDGQSNILEKISPFRVLAQKEISPKSMLELEYSLFGSFFIQGTLFRHDIIREIGAFDKDLMGDDIVLRCKLYNFLLKNPEYTFRVFPQTACYLREHGNNIHKNTLRQIRLVGEVLQRFFPDRPNPPILYNWIHTALSSNSFEASLATFSHNTRLSALLKDETVQKMLKNRAIASYLQEQSR